MSTRPAISITAVRTVDRACTETMPLLPTRSSAMSTDTVTSSIAVPTTRPVNTAGGSTVRPGWVVLRDAVGGSTDRPVSVLVIAVVVVAAVVVEVAEVAEAEVEGQTLGRSLPLLGPIRSLLPIRLGSFRKHSAEATVVCSAVAVTVTEGWGSHRARGIGTRTIPIWNTTPPTLTRTTTRTRSQTSTATL